MEMGKVLIVVGIVLIVAGLFISFGNKLPFNLGNLPGDINIKRDNFSFHFPVATSIVISILLTLIFYIISRFK